jgi:hypothetical protein
MIVPPFPMSTSRFGRAIFYVRTDEQRPVETTPAAESRKLWSKKPPAIDVLISDAVFRFRVIIRLE